MEKKLRKTSEDVSINCLYGEENTCNWQTMG